VGQYILVRGIEVDRFMQTGAYLVY
jgi:hypothetical protein